MNKNRFDNKLSRPGLAFQPLYKQVEEHVTQLIVEQRWKPGEMLPNEFQLASELNVSQGTVRKALNSLTDDKILNRRQGIGTFVSEHTGHHSLYRFFPLIADGRTPELPKAELLPKALWGQEGSYWEGPAYSCRFSSRDLKMVFFTPLGPRG